MTTSLPTPQLLVELEALALRLSIQQSETGMGETDDAGLVRMGIQRIEQLSAAQKMAADQ